MENLKNGANGPMVELLQSVLHKIHLYHNEINGVFDQKLDSAVKLFQGESGLPMDGIVSSDTWKALMPYLYGYRKHRIVKGDTMYRLAGHYGTTMGRMIAANPGVNPDNLHIGDMLVIPVGNVVPTDISYCYEIMAMNIHALGILYPFLKFGQIGDSELGRPIPWIRIGRGAKAVFYNASFHANEWITTPLLMKFIENFAQAYADGTLIYGYQARAIFDAVSIYLVPMVNPDGVDLVTGAMNRETEEYRNVEAIAMDYPEIPFPDGWKANIQGIDLNLQFPANWETAKENKYEQGYTGPAPRDYVGPAPLTALEARGIYQFTLAHDFLLIIAYHTQGEVIYWQYLDYMPEKSYDIAVQLAGASGYLLEETPYASGFAGYKDWFIETYNKPGYTVEAGNGENPLPISQFDQIYAANEGILVLGAVLAFLELG